MLPFASPPLVPDYDKKTLGIARERVFGDERPTPCVSVSPTSYPRRLQRL